MLRQFLQLLIDNELDQASVRIIVNTDRELDFQPAKPRSERSVVQLPPGPHTPNPDSGYVPPGLPEEFPQCVTIRFVPRAQLDVPHALAGAVQQAVWIVQQGAVLETE